MQDWKFKGQSSKKVRPIAARRAFRSSSNFELRTSNFAAAFAVLSAVAANVGGSAVAAAQETGVELRLESTTMEVGEAVDAQLVCTNIGQPDTPQLSVPQGLDLQITNPIPAQFSQMSIVNGRRSQKSTHTYSLRLTARKAGT